MPNTWFLLQYQHIETVLEKLSLKTLENVAYGISRDKDLFCKLVEAGEE